MHACLSHPRPKRGTRCCAWEREMRRQPRLIIVRTVPVLAHHKNILVFGGRQRFRNIFSRPISESARCQGNRAHQFHYRVEARPGLKHTIFVKVPDHAISCLHSSYWYSQNSFSIDGSEYGLQQTFIPSSSVADD